MLRINLLPPYIYDKQKKLKWIVISTAMIPLTLVVMLWWSAKAQGELNDANTRKSTAQALQTEYNGYVASIKKEQDNVNATKQKEDFVTNAKSYNDGWPTTYIAMRDATTPKVLLHSMYVAEDRKSVNFTGWCQYEEDLVRWWMFLRSQSDMFTDVHFKLPGHPYPPVAEASTNSGQGTGQLSMGSGGPGPGTMSASGSSGMGGAGGGRPSGGPSLGGGSSGMAGGGGQGGQGGGNSSDSVGPEEIEGKKGIKFTAFAVLKKPLASATPTWGGGGGASGGPSGGGPGGGMGGSMGPMGSTGGLKTGGL